MTLVKKRGKTFLRIHLYLPGRGVNADLSKYTLLFYNCFLADFEMNIVAIKDISDAELRPNNLKLVRVYQATDVVNCLQQFVYFMRENEPRDRRGRRERAEYCSAGA